MYGVIMAYVKKKTFKTLTIQPTLPNIIIRNAKHNSLKCHRHLKKMSQSIVQPN